MVISKHSHRDQDENHTNSHSNNANMNSKNQNCKNIRNKHHGNHNNSHRYSGYGIVKNINAVSNREAVTKLLAMIARGRVRAIAILVLFNGNNTGDRIGNCHKNNSSNGKGNSSCKNDN